MLIRQSPRDSHHAILHHIAAFATPPPRHMPLVGPKGTDAGLNASVSGPLDVPVWDRLPLTVSAQPVSGLANPDAYLSTMNEK